MKIVASILLATTIAAGGFARTAHARPSPSSITVTVAFQEVGPRPYVEAAAWSAVKRRIEATDPSIHVRLFPVVPAAWSYDATLDTVLRAATADVVSEDSARVAADESAGYLAPLDSEVAAWPDYTREWDRRLRALTTVDGHTYGVVNGSDARLIWYNREIFHKAGLPTPWQPHTWADILTAARVIKARAPGVIPLNLYAGSAKGEGAAMQGFQMLLDGTTDRLYDERSRKWVVSSRGFRDSLAFVATVYDRARSLGPPAAIALSRLTSDEIGLRLIPEGKLGIDIDGSWLSSYWSTGGARVATVAKGYGLRPDADRIWPGAPLRDPGRGLGLRRQRPLRP